MSQTSDVNQSASGFSRRGFLATGGALGALSLSAAVAGAAPAFADGASPTRPQSSPKVPEQDAQGLWWPSAAAEAAMIQQGLPVGNGRIGALTTGEPAHDVFYVTDASLWTGTANTVPESDGQLPYETEKFGSFTMLAKVAVDIPTHSTASVQDFRRTLDLSNGVVGASYQQGRARYRREVFASAPDDVIVILLTSDGGGSYTGSIALTGTHGETTAADPKGAGSSFAATLGNGLHYAATVSASSRDGRVSRNGATVTFADCSAVTIVISGGTNYTADATKGYMDPAVEPEQLARSKASAALAVRRDGLIDTHVADYRALHGRMSLSLGASSDVQRSLDTWTRLQTRAATGAPDPELEADYLQFGRYLMICGSRSGLPMGLQGLWIDRNNPAWMGDYHLDINLQMNYWMADRAGLGRCFEALASYCVSQLPVWTTTTQAVFNDARNGFRNTSGRIAGWTVAISTNIFGGSGWWWGPAGNAWLCHSLMEHYDFTLDQAYLRKIYPLLKGACEFWAARLVTTTVDGVQVLVDDHDWSPEHGPTNALGITYAQELVDDLFGRYVEATGTLDVDHDYADAIAAMRAKLYRPRVSPTTGELEEWMSPDDLGERQHRHLSPLVELFPGDRLHDDTADPAEMAGARKLLSARGSNTYGWGNAWRAACWARLGEAETAYASVALNLKPSISNSNGSSPNLFDMYSFGSSRSTLQIDANFGTPTAMIEMLVYSRVGVIELLPALPAAWAAEGRITGVGAKGGFTVDVSWSKGKVTTARIHSVGGTTTAVRWGGTSRTVTMNPGKSVTL